MIIQLLKAGAILRGWRKHRYIRKKIKRAFRKAAGIHQKKGANYKERLKEATAAYLACCKELSQAVELSISQVQATNPILDIKLTALLMSLQEYHKMLVKHIDLVERRIMKGQTIPHQDKVFSIFEPDTEWLQKGKVGKAVELGHNVLISTDQFSFIIDHKVMIKETDAKQPIELAQRLSERFSQGYKLDSISFDRGFHSALSKKALNKIFTKVIMPKKGPKTASVELEESTKDYVALRHRHSAVESNINELEHSGLNRVPDKGLPGFKKYVSLGVLAHNLKVLGGIVMEQGLLPTLVFMNKPQQKAA